MSGTKAYEETSEDEKSVVCRHCNDAAVKFSVNVKEQQDQLPMMYWFINDHIKQDCLLLSVPVPRLTFPNY